MERYVWKIRAEQKIQDLTDTVMIQFRKIQVIFESDRLKDMQKIQYERYTLGYTRRGATAIRSKYPRYKDTVCWIFTYVDSPLW